MRRLNHFNSKSFASTLVPLMIGGAVSAMAGLAFSYHWATSPKYEENIKFELVNIRENRGAINVDEDGLSSQTVNHFVTVRDMKSNKMRTLEVSNNFFRNELHKNSMLTEFEYARGRECSYNGKLSHPESFPFIEMYKHLYKAEEIECKKPLDPNSRIQVVR